MKLVIRSMVLVGALALLAGCVYGPGYGYVRSDGYNGDAYYGVSSPYYYDGYYGGWCCGPALGIGVYGDYYYRGGYRGGHRGPPSRGWQGGRRGPGPWAGGGHRGPSRGGH
jgi:hypothetical protein